MDNYIVSARKYRPATFETVVGQKALTTTLKNAIATGKLAHAYLFCGPRGVGKTTCARIFARTINCMNPTADGEACNSCESCLAFNEQRSYNIHELDAASNNSVEDIRSLIEQVRIPPQIGKYKVYIIDEVHMLSQAAFNAFLKTLEEPPRHAVFILATTEKHKILPTILSRCQIYDFNRISVGDTVEHLQYVASKEGITAEPEALNVIAQKADGGMRDALSIFDQVVSFTGGNVAYKSVIENLNVLDYEYYFRLTDCFLENKVSECLLLFNDILNKGFEGNHFITGLSCHFRDLLVAKDAATLPLLEVGAGIRERYQVQAQKCPAKFLYRAMKLCNDCDLNYRASKNKRLLVELTLIQLGQLTAEADDSGHGRSPEQTIKPIFNKLQPQQTQPAPAETAPVTPIAVGGAAPLKQTAPQPETQPATQAPAAEIAGEKRIPVMNAGTIGVSIKKPVQAAPVEEKRPMTVARPQAEENCTVYEKDLLYYWREFASRLPAEEKATAARMMNMSLKLLDATTFEAVVDNELVEKYFRNLTGPVQDYLREKLRNSKISMQIRVSEATETVRAYSRVERFQMLSRKNPDLLNLKEEFGLELF